MNQKPAKKLELVSRPMLFVFPLNCGRQPSSGRHLKSLNYFDMNGWQPERARGHADTHTMYHSTGISPPPPTSRPHSEGMSLRLSSIGCGALRPAAGRG